MASAKKLPSGNWRVKVFIGTDENGKKVFGSVTASSKKEAERQAALISYDNRKRREDRSSGRITLERAMEDYIETCRSVGKSPSTIRGYQSMKRSFGFLKTYCISEIRLRDIQKAVNEWSKRLSSKTIRNRYTFLTSVLNANSVKYDFKALRIPERRKKDMTIPTDEEVQYFLAYYKDKNIEMYKAFLLAATLGLRMSEIIALDCRTDIDFNAHTITINKAVVPDEHNKFVKKDTKTEAGKRVLKMSGVLESELLKYADPSQKVVNMSPRAVTSSFSRLKKKFGFKWRFHDLRHYTASVMMALSIENGYAKGIMGHATDEMLKRVYQHRIEKKEISVYNVLNAHTDALINGEKIEY